jgi:hypothetical protein
MQSVEMGGIHLHFIMQKSEPQQRSALTYVVLACALLSGIIRLTQLVRQACIITDIVKSDGSPE